jgi:hypothetical protein
MLPKRFGDLYNEERNSKDSKKKFRIFFFDFLFISLGGQIGLI